jgi:Homeodomain-like domain
VNGKPELRQQALALMRERPGLSDRAIARELGVGNKTVSRWRQTAAPSLPEHDELSSVDLCALLSEQGLRIGDRRLRRWRQEGVLVPQHRRWSDTGSTYIWARATVGQALEAERLLRRYRSFDEARIALFASGFRVDEQKLRDGYLRVLGRRAAQLETLLDVVSHAEPEWDAVADSVSETFAHGRSFRSLRRMRRVAEHRLPASEQSTPAAYVEQTMRSAAKTLLTGRLGSDSDIAELLHRSPGFELASVRPVPLEQRIEVSKRIQARMSFGALAQTIDTAPLEALAASSEHLLAVAAIFDGLVKPMFYLTEIADQYPRGAATEWLTGDPLQLGMFALSLQSIRSDPRLGKEIDEFIEPILDLLPDWDGIVDQIIVDVHGRLGRPVPEPDAAT